MCVRVRSPFSSGRRRERSSSFERANVDTHAIRLNGFRQTGEKNSRRNMTDGNRKRIGFDGGGGGGLERGRTGESTGKPDDGTRHTNDGG